VAILKFYTTSLLHRGWPALDEIHSLMQNSTPITVIWSTRHNRKKNSKMADVCFF